MINRQLTYLDYFLLLCIVALTLVIYSSAVHFEFTNWDDDIHVTNNPAVQVLSMKSVVDLFTPTEKYMYHPLTMLSYMIEWNIVGETPWLFHATNITLHCINICLVFLLVFQLSRNKYLTFLIASLFALHPLQIESVAWISARKDLLAGMFMLSSAICYYRWKASNERRIYIVSIVLFIFSLLSKPSAVVVPLLFIIINIWQEKKMTVGRAKDILPFGTLSVIITLFIVQTTASHSVLPMHFYTLTQRVTLIIYEFGFYSIKFIDPISLSACYSYPHLNNGALSIQYYLGALISLVVILLIFILRKNMGAIVLGLVLYCVCILPVVQIIPFNNASLVADRYAYLGILGLSLSFLCAIEIVRVKFNINDVIMSVIVVLVIGTLSYLSLERLPVWNNSISLFDDVIKKNPNTAIAYGNRANAKVFKGDFEGAIHDCNTLLVLFPEEPKAYYNRGNAYSEMKKYQEALTDYSKSIMLGFKSPHIFYNRGNQYVALKEYDSAAADYETVLQLTPAYLAALLQLNFIASDIKKDYTKSVFYLTEYLTYNPNDVSVYFRRAQSNVQLGQFGAALRDAAFAVSLNRNNNNISDHFIASLNNAVDSINVKISAVSVLIRTKDKTARKKLYRLRSKLYWSLGDTLRAKKDMQASELGSTQ